MLSGRPARIAVSGLALAIAFGAGAACVTAADGPSQRHSSGDRTIDAAIATIEAKSAHPVSTSALQQAAVQGMLSALKDRWATYYNRQDFSHYEQVLGGSYSGVGLWVSREPSGGVRVLRVQPHSPARRAGVRSGDEILTIAGESMRGRPVAAVTDRLRGKSGSHVSVTVASSSGRVSSVSLRRAGIVDDDVTTSMLTPTVERIRIAAFTTGVGSQVRSLVTAAQQRHLSGIVLDLRDNPGGLLDEAVETASAFLHGGPVVTYVQRGQAPRTLDALGGGNVALPLVVLVNGGTASAAEIVASALQERGRAVLLGSQTFGKGTVQAPQRLPSGSAVELTVGHYLTASGRSLENVGITPDVLIPPQTSQAVVDNRALEVLNGLTADADSNGRG